MFEVLSTEESDLIRKTIKIGNSCVIKSFSSKVVKDRTIYKAQKST
jgi:hypothetical protein